MLDLRESIEFALKWGSFQLANPRALASWKRTPQWRQRVGPSAAQSQFLENHRGLAHFVAGTIASMVAEQNVPVPLSANGIRTGSKLIEYFGAGIIIFSLVGHQVVEPHAALIDDRATGFFPSSSNLTT